MRLTKLLILLILILQSCSYNNYSVHERNMEVQNMRMIKHDISYKNKMIKTRKRSSKSHSVNHKKQRKSKSKFII
jgi:hypothetical protein